MVENVRVRNTDQRKLKNFQERLLKRLLIVRYIVKGNLKDFKSTSSRFLKNADVIS